MKLNITVDGRTYEVEVEASEPERPSHRLPGPQAHVTLPAVSPAAAPAAAAAAPVADESKVCRSPVNGTVVRVVASAGDSMKAGDVLLVLEAMKMETAIAAPSDGVVATLSAKVGDAVKTGEVLVEFE